MTPSISILAPAYNCAPFIGDMIRSIQNQTVVDWELVIVDDGSVDGTAAVAASFAGRDQRVRVFRINHSGYANAFNAAFVASWGEIIARQDADDLSEPARLERQLERLSSPNTIVSCGLSRLKGQKKTVDGTATGMVPENYWNDPVPQGPIGASLVCFRHVYRDVGLFQPEYEWAADSDWNLRALLWRPALRWLYVPEPLYVYRVHKGQMTQRGDEGERGKQDFEKARCFYRSRRI